MNKTSGFSALVLVAGILCGVPADASEVSDWSGTWLGKTVVQETEDALTLVLTKVKTSYTGTLQDAFGIIAAGTEIKDVKVLPNNGLKFTFQTVEGASIETTLTVNGESMKGEWIDAVHGERGPVELARKK